ncbi:MAG: glutathione S-transferase family protein [Pseudomonadota bacterium]
MPDLKLYHYPMRACSHVTFTALVETGLEFSDQSIDIVKGQQKSPEYLKIHPAGKVPALVVDGATLTENAAMLMYINGLAPDAGLLPAASDSFDQAKVFADLVWVSATFHPSVRQVRMAMRLTDGDPAGVQAKGIEFTTAIFDMLEQRLANDQWWYGDTWSILDVYINWCVITAASTQLMPMEKYPAIGSHMGRVHARPAFQQSMARQMASKERDGIVFPDE